MMTNGPEDHVRAVLDVLSILEGKAVGNLISTLLAMRPIAMSIFGGCIRFPCVEATSSGATTLELDNSNHTLNA